MSEEKKESRLLVDQGLFPDVLKLLSDGSCLGLSAPPLPGAFVFTVAMEVTETQKDAMLAYPSANHLVLSDVSVRLGDHYEAGPCQGCTLHVTIDTGVKLGAGVAKVKVHLDRKTKCGGKPTIVITP
jgi:hypothetical protein